MIPSVILKPFKKHIKYVNDIIRKESPASNHMRTTQLAKVYKRDQGRCRFCGAKVHLHGAYAFHFYIPLYLGGKASDENLIIVCNTHSEYFMAAPKRQEDVFGINSFADLAEQLFNAIFANESREKIDRIKRMMNWTLEDMAATMRYKVYDDWKPEKFELIVDQSNTIPDLMEKLPESKKEITEQVKQIVTAKKYKIIY